MLKIKVSYATPETQVEIPLEVENNTTVVMAIRRSGVLEQFPEIDLPSVQVGVWNKKVALDDLLHQGDRVEIYRPLIIDPKAARLLRAKRANKK